MNCVIDLQEYAIETEGLSKRFLVSGGDGRGFRWITPLIKGEYASVLKDVNLKVRNGEVFGLLGPNGSGKTTLIKILCTLILPSSGSARVAGFDVVSEDSRVQESSALVYMSQRSLYWRLTGRQNLEFFGTLYNIPAKKLRKRIEEVLELVGLSDRAEEKVVVYSSGMKYRLSIARGLLSDPAVVFMDEPTIGLDSSSSRGMREFIRKQLVGEGGKTVFLATNNIAEADFLCDRVGVIDGGFLKAVDSPRNLMRGGASLEDVFLKLTGEGAP